MSSELHARTRRIPTETSYVEGDLFEPLDGGDATRSVIFAHGGGQTRHSWAATAAEFARHGWRSLAYDARGHGTSGRVARSDYVLDGFVADLVAVADAFAEHPVIVGASLGGQTALAATGEGSVHPCALVLVDVAPRLEMAGVDRILGFLGGHLDGFASLDEAADAITHYNPRSRGRNPEGLRKNLRQRGDGRWYWHWDPAFFEQAAVNDAADTQRRLSAAASRIDVPVLLVHGRHSDVLADGGVDDLKTLIPHITVAKADAGHMVAGDDNARFAASVLTFAEQSVA